MTNEFAASFILLAYNQQDSVAASVQAVLDQQCEPLEVILSDDASSDGTFDVLQKMAESYRGPHHVSARRNAQNMGINRHLEHLIELAQCDFTIWSAGDDISTPQRAQIMIDGHRKSGAKLVYSDALTLRDDGQAGSNSYHKALFYRSGYTLEDVGTSFALYLGATLGLHRDLYLKYGPLPKDRAHEDLIFGFRAALEDSLHYIPEKLVTYREQGGTSSYLSGRTSSLDNRERRRAILKGQYSVLQQRLQDAYTYGIGEDHPVCRAIRRLCDRVAMRLSFYEGGRMPYIRQPFLLAHSLLSEWLRDLRKR